MSMKQKLFRPGKGQTVERFSAAFINGTGVYPGDLVCWDITAPTDQGSSGVLEGKSLGAYDFIYVILPPAAQAAAIGLQAGIVRGPGLDYQAPATVMVNDKLAIVQTYGVCATAWVDSTDTVAGDMLCTGATTGELTKTKGTDAVGTDTTVGEGTLCAFALTADSAVTRATTSEQYCSVFVRCDF